MGKAGNLIKQKIKTARKEKQKEKENEGRENRGESRTT